MSRAAKWIALVIFKDRYPSYLTIEVTETATKERLLCGARRRIKYYEGQETARADWSMDGVRR